MTDIEAAAWNLRHHLFAKRHDMGAIGIGTDRLFVYIWNDWASETPETWEGFPVTWRIGGGMPVASVPAPSSGETN